MKVLMEEMKHAVPTKGGSHVRNATPFSNLLFPFPSPLGYNGVNCIATEHQVSTLDGYPLLQAFASTHAATVLQSNSW